ncbi:MAG: Histidine kinase [Pedosphaera sp.]|nr:Histidine kinase [Pedosphaera sp.]
MKSKRWLLSVAGAGALFGMTLSCLGQHGSNWRVYRAADGLPDTQIAAITVGPHGHLWVRHPYKEWVGWLDGYEVKAIPGPGLGTSRIYESAAGQIWTCSIEGLQRYQDPENGWIHYSMPEVADEYRTNSLNFYRTGVPLCPLKQNHLLLLLPDRLIECDVENPTRPLTTLLRAANQTGLQKFFGLATARDGGLWITGAKGLTKVPGPVRNLKPDTIWEEHLPPEAKQLRNLREPIEDEEGGVTCLAEAPDGSRQFIAHFDGQQWTAQSTFSEKITQGWRSPDKICWATTPASLLEIKAGAAQFVTNETIPARRFLDVAVETNGIFWLATSDGLFRYAPLCWRIPANAPGLDSSVSCLTEDREDRIWAATAGGLQLFQNEHWTNFAFPPELGGDARENRALFALTNGTVVMEADGRLLQFDPRTSRFNYVSDPQAAQLKPLGLLKGGTLCVQAISSDSSGGRVARLEVFDGATFTGFPLPQPDLGSSNEPHLFLASQNGNLWLAGTKGISWYHDKKWQAFTPATQPASAGLACMAEISDGKIWCGIEDKIWEFDGKTWNLIRAGFDRVNALTKTADGSIWVASDNGLHRFLHGTWTANGAEEGLPPGAAVRAVYEDRHGHLWAATARGLCLYHQDADLDPPQTFVQNLPERNNTVPEGAFVNISFGAQDKWKYTAEDRLVYSYRLDGQDWSPFQEQRNASFLDLPAGKHSFFVRSMDRNWNVDPKPAVLEFAIAAPWYRETRLMLISSAGLAAALFFAGLAFNRHRRLVRSYAEVEAKVALRTKQLEIANQELFHSQKMNALGTLAAGIAHDFNNILSIIKGSAQIIESNLDDPGKIATRTDRIKTVVEQGAGIVKAMLGFSRTSDHHLAWCNVNAVVEETVKLLGDRFLRETEVQFTPSPALPEVPASKDFIQQILLNFIFNAAEAMTERRQVILNATQSSQLPPTLPLKPAIAASYNL